MAGRNQSLRCQPLLGWLFDSRAPALGPFTPSAPGAHWGQVGGSNLQLRASTFQRAKKRLIATHPNSEIELTDWNQRTLTISNRNTNRLCSFHICSVSLLLPGESIPAREGESSVQLRPPSPQNPIANLRLESRVTRSKQTVAPSSNREKFQAVPMNLSTSFPSPAASRPLSRADALSYSLHSDSLHCRCDTCNISPSKSCSGVHFVQLSGHVIAKHHALLIVREASDPNQTARGRRMKK
jgi:hypothetical protein